ncbi:hypothetical protein [Nocardia terpenica]|uniref:Uncharacterized protein n=1 Tax=Nocardia terpenica TaxID=455432 RepID=A0A291RC98_9NOCA|nr:hypothetical protein [Nocardia terpenica]ATL64918.1 hypothetical protein CRH09_00385 [Nocardia terpenica]
MPAGPSRIRGALVGATVAALAVAAHGPTGGYPNSTALTLLVAAAAATGALASALPAPRGIGGRAALFATVAAGQLIGHRALSGLAGHGHETGRAASLSVLGVRIPGGWMTVAHVLAALGCVLLIVAAERLYSLVSQAVRTVTGRLRTPPPPVGIARRGAGDRHYDSHHITALGSRAPPVPA